MRLLKVLFRVTHSLADLAQQAYSVESLRRVDNAARNRVVLHRRKCSVCSYHKIIRWRIVIHGVIDSFLHAATNNNSRLWSPIKSEM